MQMFVESLPLYQKLNIPTRILDIASYVITTTFYVVPAERWMDGGLAILHSFQQQFSYIRTVDG